MAEIKNEVLTKDLIKSPETIAADLQRFVQEQGLSQVLKAGSKPYVFSEGWCFLLEQAKDTVSTTVEIIRENGIDVIATAVIEHVDGRKTTATAVCSSQEVLVGRKRWDALHQIVSMAQTRAVSKASQLCYKHYMSMAGFATTPAEEMAEVVDNDQSNYSDAPASSKQKNYLSKLVNEAGANLNELLKEIGATPATLTAEQASELINKFKGE